MRYKNIAAFILAVMMLLVFAACSNATDSDADDHGDDEESEETAETETALTTVSATLERPEAPVQTPRPDRTEKPQVSSSGETGYDVGDVLPDFSVPMAGGGTFTLSENLGRPVFINLFATWCPPCVAEMPEIDDLYAEFGSAAAFIVIDIGEDEATAQDFGDSNGYSLPFAYSLDGMPFGSDYYVEYIPQTFVLSANGTIVAFFDGSRDYDTFRSALEEAMAQ